MSFIKNIESDVGISYLVASSSKEVFTQQMKLIL
ncbi:hypothetical protein OBE_08994 [human gut metagenome]|uniref:Uncharacterized protein n=1 Tax=human gut metagenome TaxID=408170 RepID=K1SS33_9ZZZZ